MADGLSEVGNFSAVLRNTLSICWSVCSFAFIVLLVYLTAKVAKRFVFANDYDFFLKKMAVPLVQFIKM